MKTRNHSLLISLALTLSIAPICLAADGPYKLLKEIPIGGATSWDYLLVDSDAQRLYVSHGTEVVVIDLSKDEVVGKIANTMGVHGFAIAPSLQKGFSSNGRENKVSVVDLKTLETTSKVDTGANPDCIIYEPKHNEVYAFNGRGQSATVIAADSLKVVATIPLGGKPEYAVCDPEAGRIFNNLEDKSTIAVIDTAKHEVVNTWLLAPGKSPTGLGFDLKNHRLFMSCDNNLMVMMDSTSGKVVTTVPIGGGADGCWFDPGTQYAFSSNGGDGNVTIAHEDAPDKLTVVQTLPTLPRSRTMTVDPKTHKIYLPAIKPDAASAGKKGASGSFVVLVCGM
jgi:DNA-binding beta-propeller fold protein YncE